MSVFDAVQRDLEKIREVAPELADSALAETALSLAQELDAGNSATSKSMCAKAMIDVLRELRALAPVRRETDDVDELAVARAARRAEAAAH